MIGNVSQAWLDWNFLEGEADSVARVKEATQTGPGAWARIVGTRDDLDAITEEQQVNPGVYVIYTGPQLIEANERGALVRHSWRVVLAVASAAGGAKGREASPRNLVAGKFLPHLLQALHGYIPKGSTTALVPVTPPPMWPNGKFAYYPLAFTSDCHYSTQKGPANRPMPR